MSMPEFQNNYLSRETEHIIQKLLSVKTTDIESFHLAPINNNNKRPSIPENLKKGQSNRKNKFEF